jgi:hypothetical protein
VRTLPDGDQGILEQLLGEPVIRGELEKIVEERYSIAVVQTGESRPASVRNPLDERCVGIRLLLCDPTHPLHQRRAHGGATFHICVMLSLSFIS